MKVLVTGASGFIGRQTLTLLLEKGFDVHAVCSKSSEDKVLNDKCSTWHFVNLLNNDEVKQLFLQVKPDYLLHLAWDVTPGSYLKSNNNFDWQLASMQLITYFKTNGGRRLVTAGTCFEYDSQYGYCREDVTPLDYSTPYSSCKNGLRMFTESFCSINELSSAWARIFFVYGPYENQQRLVSSIIGNLLNNQDALCSYGEQVRDYMYVEDVAKALVCLLCSDVIGTVNIGSGNPIKVKDIVNTIAKQLNRVELIKVGAIKTNPFESPCIIADNRRLKEEVGWNNCISLEDGMFKTIEWWKTRIVNKR